MKDFVHLHVHSEYSLLDGYASTKAIAQRAVELGMDSIALTDHGVMYGAMEFYDAAKKAGIKPIIGVEAYIAPGSRTSQMVKGGKNYYHLLLLAKNEVGYRNLVHLTTRSHLDGMGKGIFARPRIDRELLEQHHEGLIVTSSCIAGEVIQALTAQQRDQAVAMAAYYRDLLGPDNYFLELQLHDNTPELEGINEELVRIGNELGIPLVATSDTHFVRPEDVKTQHMVMSMGMNLTYQEFCAKDFAMDESYHIMSGEAMWERFKRYGTGPMENTRRIAEMCNLKLDFGRVQLPQFDLPEGHDASSYLKLVCEEGLMKRFHGAPPDHYMARLEDELDVINATGFPDYMLIVWDYVKYARSRGIPCLPRGSAGASLVLYALEITDVDPVANKLLFERFLSRERLEMPDIDTDFADSRRGEILDYIATKYGRENVAQIITYGTLGAKAALRDMGRVLGIELSEVDRVARLIPTLPVGTTIAQALERVPELRQIYETQPHLKDLIDWAKKVEGRMRSVGTHACGLVVSRSPLEDLVPLQRTTKDDQAVMAAFEGSTLAKMGLLKMDILGLTNLSIVAEALKYIERSTGQSLWLDQIPLDDPKVFASLGRGETRNVFQLESAGMTRYLMQLKPTRVEDLYAMVALYRPGPLEQIPLYIANKNNPGQIKYLHPILKPILEDTYGVIVYQEQIMQLLQSVADYTLGQAYVVIKAISKKDKTLMAENGAIFKAGCLKKGISQQVADELWELILPFAGYSFNRPHATLYGLLSYQTSWLKVNYPVEYMAAVLTGAGGTIEDIAKGALEARRLGIAVLQPDVNASQKGFEIEALNGTLPVGVQFDRGIRFGLAAIKNVGDGPVEAIIAERETNGSFQSLEDLCGRVDRHAINKRVLESLIKGGAFDSMPGSRRQKLAILDQAISAGAEAQKARDVGQSSLFDMFGETTGGTQSLNVSRVPMPIITPTPAEMKEELLWEKELLGLNVSEDPVARALEGVDLTDVSNLSDISEESIGSTMTFVGVLNGVRRITTRKGDTMLVANLEDLTGTIELVAFPRTLAKAGDLLCDDGAVKLTAKVDNRRDVTQLVVETVEPVVAAAQPAPAPIASEMDLEGFGELVEPEAGPGATATGSVREPARTINDATRAPVPVPPTPNPSTPPTTPITTIRAKQQVKVNGGESRGNGKGNGSASNGGTYHETPTVPQGRTLRLYLLRTGNDEADVRCMQDIYSVLRESVGPDRVTLYLPNGVGTVILQSQHTIQISSGLIDNLKGVLGAERVIAE
ncbi:DNA polymerase III subunit alpha [Candidatus Chloroploca sp. M-50]|uniref:DNA polymerase III subunit alpha n=1 Tax=Candidatus Chloroploca mongolica TaxID=2528176 RepID=A0ABS4DGZ7_9CHLR|nr:DNA polymerase III subunit alpha [Candidatus Chloroploca mongolica]MBP1468726.1 DNA polymerase III subunit alpha [Candidatus Chloroploca mongolica]